ncbi:hypothetical protein F4813DRAFT_401223 [Daldinia decipiens]|uniref:uncharacterized protein n=1 Tax=Daldinia decipiens TaxID=326647 RepID=UPI0020C2967A|nr:uncharacterized protein F4813DRAFT_401223 [Daldinia decipiens]KAI1660286.1 hypothetical protein F4813DRAFT_401223 [Daldinia decipiens]
MSFFNKLTSKLDELNLGGSEKPREREAYPSHQNYPPPSQQYGTSHGREPYPPNPPNPQSGGASGYPPQYGSNYNTPPPGNYSSPPPPAPGAGPTYSPPSDKPPIPAGWTPQFDQQYQRWYYYEQATGRSQWEAPGYHAGGGQTEGDRGSGSHGETNYSSHDAPGYPQDSRGYSSHGGYGEQGGYGYGHGGQSYGNRPEEDYNRQGSEEKKKKKKDNSGLLMGAAGGLAVGAIGGALIANALDDSDDERHQAAPAIAPAPVYAAPPPAPVYEPVYEPMYNAEGEYVDASDRESVRSAREDYEEALAKAQDSDASSSDFEELEEAREEYQEEYEEAYED